MPADSATHATKPGTASHGQASAQATGSASLHQQQQPPASHAQAISSVRSLAACRTESSLAESVAVHAALLHSFEACDQQVPAAAAAEGGTTAVCALVGRDRIYVANTGKCCGGRVKLHRCDSRAVVGRMNGAAIALTDDHKPERPDERARIRAAGGQVFWHGGHRVMGVLSMSRALGDSLLKPFGVIATPEICDAARHPDDLFLLLATDGLWAALDNDAAVKLARVCVLRALSRGVDRQTSLRLAAQLLVKSALQAGSRDNVTVLLVDLQGDGDIGEERGAAMSHSGVITLSDAAPGSNVKKAVSDCSHFVLSPSSLCTEESSEATCSALEGPDIDRNAASWHRALGQDEQASPFAQGPPTMSQGGSEVSHTTPDCKPEPHAPCTEASGAMEDTDPRLDTPLSSSPEQQLPPSCPLADICQEQPIHAKKEQAGLPMTCQGLAGCADLSMGPATPPVARSGGRADRNRLLLASRAVRFHSLSAVTTVPGARIGLGASTSGLVSGLSCGVAAEVAAELAPGEGKSLSSHLPGCGVGLALAALPLPLPLPLPLAGWVGSAACSASVRLLRLAGGGVLGPGSEAAGCVASWLLHGACGELWGATTGHHIRPRTGCKPHIALCIMTTRCASLNGASQARLSRVRPQVSRRDVGLSLGSLACLSALAPSIAAAKDLKAAQAEKEARKAALRAAAEKTKESGRATEVWPLTSLSTQSVRKPARLTSGLVKVKLHGSWQTGIDGRGVSLGGSMWLRACQGPGIPQRLVVLAEDQKRGRMSSLRPGHLSATETIQPAAGNEGSSQYTTTYMAQSQSTTAPRKAQGKRMVNTQQSHTRATSLGSFAGFATPARDPVKDIQALQQGTTKASQHLPGYTGHISKQTSANQPTVVRDLDKSAPLILHNFHPVCPGLQYLELGLMPQAFGYSSPEDMTCASSSSSCPATAQPTKMQLTRSLRAAAGSAVPRPARVVALRAAATEVEPKTQSTPAVGPSSSALKAELPDVQPSTLEVQRFLNTLVTETSIAEMHLQVGNFELRVRRSTKDGSASSPVAPQQTVVITTPAPTPMETLKSLEESMDESLVPILSPKVGIFRRGKYAAGKRIGKGNAVNEGEQVKRGQVLGYVEQLGTFVPVESPQAGEAVKFLIADGSPVEYRQEVVDLAPFFGGHIIGDR
ncbi:hypothetical protein QJQ45_026070 [Haematococcus lacustris]|nr:hypothetical protein QJQ45_026070 [Haematococcus lacustris]